MSHSQRTNRRGLSLVEVAVSSLLVGTVVVGSLEMLGASVRTQTFCRDVTVGPVLADALLAEIMSMPYEDPEDTDGSIGRESGESGGDRNTWDDVDDYNGWTQNPPQLKDGTVLSEFANWQRASTVTWATRTDGNVWGLYDSGLKRIIVTVTSPTGISFKRFGLRSQDGSLEQAPATDRIVVTQIETTLSVGTPATTAHSATNLLNHVEEPRP